MPIYADVIVALALVAVAVVATVSTRKVRQVNRRFRLLDEISQVADEGKTLDETLEAIAEIVVPVLGDICAIDVIEGDRVRRAALRVDGPEADAFEERLMARGPRLQTQIASDASRERQEPRRFELRSEEDLREFAADEKDLDFLRSLGVTSGAGRWRRPLARRGPKTRSAAISTTPSASPAAGWW